MTKAPPGLGTAGAWQLTTAPNQDSYSPHLKSAQGPLDQFLLVGVMDDPLKREPIDMRFTLVTRDQVIRSERLKQAIPAVLSCLTNRKATSATRLPRSPQIWLKRFGSHNVACVPSPESIRKVQASCPKSHLNR